MLPEASLKHMYSRRSKKKEKKKKLQKFESKRKKTKHNLISENQVGCDPFTRGVRVRRFSHREYKQRERNYISINLNYVSSRSNEKKNI